MTDFIRQFFKSEFKVLTCYISIFRVNFKITLSTKGRDKILNFKFQRHITIFYLTSNQISLIMMTDFIHHFFKREKEWIDKLHSTLIPIGSGHQ